jgi:hypothetical protein
MVIWSIGCKKSSRAQSCPGRVAGKRVPHSVLAQKKRFHSSVLMSVTVEPSKWNLHLHRDTHRS